MKAQFNPSTSIAACCDTNASRYALGNVCVSPAPDGKHVWLTACDSRTLACVKEPGEAIAPMACPSSAFKPGKGKAIIRDNGHWVDRKNTIHPADDNPGRFPRCDEVIPDVDCDNLVVTIDAELLLNLAKAINTADSKRGSLRPTVITLFLPKPNSHNVVESAIAAVGDAGIGVIMPFHAPGNQSAAEARASHTRNFRERRNEFVKEFATFTPPAS